MGSLIFFAKRTSENAILHCNARFYLHRRNRCWVAPLRTYWPQRRDRSPCHYSKLFTYARFLPPRSGLMNLAVGFNLVFSQNMSIYGWRPFGTAPSALLALRLIDENVTLKQLSERRRVTPRAAKPFRFASNPRK